MWENCLHFPKLRLKRTLLPPSLSPGLTIHIGADVVGGVVPHAGPGGHVQRRRVQAGQGVQGAQQRHSGLRLQGRTEEQQRCQMKLLFFQTSPGFNADSHWVTGQDVGGE